MKVAALAGGVGGARLCHGLWRVHPQDLSIVVNTADDFELHGLTICPDLDTVLYTLAEWADPVQGWGILNDSWTNAQQLARLGGETWFRLGDRDLATHLFRTHLLRQGHSKTEVTRRLGQAAGLPSQLLWPMCDQAVTTRLRLAEGWVDFQDYFVRRQHRDRVEEVAYAGAEKAVLSPELAEVLQAAERIVLAPSNPYLSLLPILQLAGPLWPHLKARKVAISPMIGGQAVKGPLAELLDSLGQPVSSLGIARLLREWVDVLVLDDSDAPLLGAIEETGLQAVCVPTLMKGFGDREELARVALRV